MYRYGIERIFIDIKRKRKFKKRYLKEEEKEKATVRIFSLSFIVTRIVIRRGHDFS